MLRIFEKINIPFIMKQNIIFIVIGILLILQGGAFYFMNVQISASHFPELDAAGLSAAGAAFRLSGVITAAVGFITLSARSFPGVLWAYALGFLLISLNGFKDIFAEHLNVPLTGPIIQLVISLVCVYLWIQSRKQKA